MSQNWTQIADMAELEALYAAAVPASVEKVARSMTPCYQRWIEAARFVVLSTVGPEGTDASPRGDVGPVVEIYDATTLLLPDWRGNNRIDSLRNIVRDPRVSLMFMVPGSSNVVRINGRAILSADEALTGRFEKGETRPKIVCVISIEEMYFQCAKAILRSEIWGDTARPDIPTAGDFIKEIKAGFDGAGYDDGYAAYAKSRMW